VVIEQDPTQRLKPLVLVAAAEPAGAGSEVGEDGTALREALAAVLQHRRFAQFVH
jgi:hypothetical protein